MDSRRGFFGKLAAVLLAPKLEPEPEPTSLQPSDFYTPINAITDVPSGVCCTRSYIFSDLDLNPIVQNDDAFRKSLGLGESK